MATSTSTALSVSTREPSGSRAARRLRREGQVLGVVYGGGAEPIAFQVDGRMLRQVLAHAGAVIDLSVDGATPSPVVVKEEARHPVTGDTVHLDLLRVRLDVAIQSTTVLELVGVDDAPGTKEGGVLEHVTRELNIEALPGDIPDSLSHDVSEMQIGDTLTLESIAVPRGVTLLDDPETVIATLTPPKLQLEEEETEIEEETELVGEGEAAEQGEAAEEGGESGGEDESDSGDGE